MHNMCRGNGLVYGSNLQFGEGIVGFSYTSLSIKKYTIT